MITTSASLLLALLYPEVGKFTAADPSSDAPLAHLDEPVSESTLDPKDQSKISLKIPHFPLLVA